MIVLIIRIKVVLFVAINMLKKVMKEVGGYRKIKNKKRSRRVQNSCFIVIDGALSQCGYE